MFQCLLCIYTVKEFVKGGKNRLFQFLVMHAMNEYVCLCVCVLDTTLNRIQMKCLTYLPIFVSSSSSDGALLFRRHNVAIIPMCNVKQQTKSMISNSKRTPPTATAIIEADVTGFAGITKSRPIIIGDHKSIPFCSFPLVINCCWNYFFVFVFWFMQSVFVCLCSECA